MHISITQKTLLLFIILSSSIIFSQEIHEVSIHKLQKMEFGSSEKFPSKFAVDGLDIIPLQINEAKELSRKVFGYLPDWEYLDGTHQYLQYDLLTHIAAFDFGVSSTGSVGNPAGWPWTDLINTAHSAGTKVILTAVNFDEDDIRKIITDSTTTQTFFTNIKNKIETYNLDGVNIDFEGLYSADRGAVINSFMAALTEYIHTELPGKEVSFAGPAVNWGGWDLDGLVQSCDYVFIMGYAFWGSWSTTSGPNAPLTGGSRNITTTITGDYGVPVSKYPEKVILGVPYYGHTWKTTSSAAYSSTIDFIGSNRFRTAQPESEIYGILWDSQSQTAWYRYQNSDWYQVWYDDVLSLDKKYDLANSHDLAGIGMWALGYDGSRQELWDLINNKFGDGSLPIPNTPRSFNVMQENANTLLLKFEKSDWADRYGVYMSRDGLNFDRIIEDSTNEISITNLTSDSVYYFKVEAVNDSGASYVTEVLGGIPSEYKNDILIVNGFERTSSTNNTFDYIRMYGEPFMQTSRNFSSTSNDAVFKGYVDLNDYKIVIWMLLDESTANETFNSIEQGLVADYLTNGGKLFVSGAEIGWDLVEKGSTADKAFYRDYLHAKYISDAPGGESGSYYTASPTSSGIFDGLGDINFDNGTHGTIDVDWPDAITTIDDGSVTNNDLSYKGITSSSKGYSGISYVGYSGDGNQIGKVIYLAFPFETIYVDSQRIAVFDAFMLYMDKIIIGVDENDNIIPNDYSLKQNYPNPFNPSTIISFAIPNATNVKISIFDLLGQKVEMLVNQDFGAGNHKVEFNASGLSSGIYYYRMEADSFVDIKKMMILR